MTYLSRYETPDGFDDIIIRSDGEYLTGLSFIQSDSHSDKQKQNPEECICRDKKLPIIDETKLWLDIYFSGHQPEKMPSYRIIGATPFRTEVIEIIMSVPFGETVTYGEVACQIADRHGIAKMSAQAVGGAVGWNPICIIIPCHRIIGSNNRLTGYGGGMNNKIALLRIEGHDTDKMIY